MFLNLFGSARNLYCFSNTLSMLVYIKVKTHGEGHYVKNCYELKPSLQGTKFEIKNSYFTCEPESEHIKSYFTMFKKYGNDCSFLQTCTCMLKFTVNLNLNNYYKVTEKKDKRTSWQMDYLNIRFPRLTFSESCMQMHLHI